ncbi:uncharacterized protein Dana_GF26843, isoform B [Drosophila ananassae]|uniref:Uncharacterized protein, isoform A n=1 Tax=Drosophila ananassae TaxID=7217 RepID=A0A0P8XUH0_DROAN|nr:uncharacterized protein Dana_GF26843, isoform A [Drosophila ananassae]KPU78374.1 uncharacterized protein Dana_GF26843, isoform B [Drosophila ananassae]
MRSARRWMSYQMYGPFCGNKCSKHPQKRHQRRPPSTSSFDFSFGHKVQARKYSVMQNAFVQRSVGLAGGAQGRMGGDRRRPLNIERSFGIRLGIQNAVHFLPVDGSKNSPTLHRRVNGAERAANG